MRRPFRFTVPQWFCNAVLNGTKERSPLWRVASLWRTHAAWRWRLSRARR